MLLAKTCYDITVILYDFIVTSSRDGFVPCVYAGPEDQIFKVQKNEG